MKTVAMVEKCCFCGKNVEGWGNNPAPVNNKDGARCCNACNANVVIPARIISIRKHGKRIF